MALFGRTIVSIIYARFGGVSSPKPGNSDFRRRAPSEPTRSASILAAGFGAARTSPWLNPAAVREAGRGVWEPCIRPHKLQFKSIKRYKKIQNLAPDPTLCKRAFCRVDLCCR